MEQISETRHKIDILVERNGRYPAAAYEFVAEAVQEAVKRLDAPRHVSAEELLAVFRDYAGESFGPMTGLVLETWGIVSASDVGHIVYEMIGVELLSAAPEDRESDFDVVFSLSAEPEKSSETRGRKRTSRKVPKID